MRAQVLPLLCAVLLVPAFSIAQEKTLPQKTLPEKASVTTEADEEEDVATIGSSDICLNETIVLDPAAEELISIEPGTRVPDATCACVIGEVDGVPTYSGVGIVTFKDQDGRTTKTVSKCDPRGSGIDAALASGDPETELAREETRALLEDAVLSTGTLPEEYSRIFEEAGIDTDELFEGRSRTDAARLVSDLAFGDERAKSVAAEVAGIPPEQLQRLATNAVRLTPDRYQDAARVFNDNLNTTEKDQYYGVLTTFAAHQTLARENVNPNARRPTSAESAAAAQLAYNDVLSLGYDPRDLVRGQGQSAEKMTLGQAATVEAYRNRLNDAGLLHPELDRALAFSILRREGGVLGNGADLTSNTGVRGPFQVTSGTANATFGNTTGFTVAGGRTVSAVEFAREDAIGSYMTGMAVLNNNLFVHAPLTEAGYSQQGVINALQSYNSGSPNSCVGGDCNFGAKAYHDTQIMRQAIASGSGNIDAITQSLGSLYGDRTRSEDERVLWAMALAAEPLDGSFLPPANYATQPFSQFIARVTIPGANGVNSPLNVSTFVTDVVDSVFMGTPPREALQEETSEWINTAYSAVTGRERPEGGIFGGFFRQLFQGGFGGGSSEDNDAQRGIFRQPTGGGTPTSTSTISSQAVSAIIVQPREVLRGKAAVVSWSSVGMSAGVPCEVHMQMGSSTRIVVGVGNEGTRSIETSATTTLGVWDILLECTAQSSGARIEQKTSVHVR